MPLNINDKLPAIEILREENIFVMDSSQASHQDIRPLKIVILNLMPLKISTETDLLRLLSNSPLQIEIDFLKIKGHTPKNTPSEHMIDGVTYPMSMHIVTLLMRFLWKRHLTLRTGWTRVDG